MTHTYTHTYTYPTRTSYPHPPSPLANSSMSPALFSAVRNLGQSREISMPSFAGTFAEVKIYVPDTAGASDIVPLLAESLLFSIAV